MRMRMMITFFVSIFFITGCNNDKKQSTAESTTQTEISSSDQRLFAELTREARTNKGLQGTVTGKTISRSFTDIIRKAQNNKEFDCTGYGSGLLNPEKEMGNGLFGILYFQYNDRFIILVSEVFQNHEIVKDVIVTEFKAGWVISGMTIPMLGIGPLNSDGNMIIEHAWKFNNQNQKLEEINEKGNVWELPSY